MEKINNADSRATDIGTSESALDFEQHLEKLKQERLLGLKRFLNCDKKIKSDIFGAIDYIDVNEPTKTQDCLYAAASDCGQYFEIMLEYCGYDQTWVTNQINIIKNAIVLTGASKEKMHGVYRDFFTNLSREFCEAVEVSAFGFSTSTCYEGRWEDVVGGATSINGILHALHSCALSDRRLWERLPSIESSDSRVMLYGDTTGTESIARGFYDFASEIDDDINLQMMTINSYTILMAKRGESTVKLTIDEQGYPDLYTNYILPGACRVERTTLAPRAPHIVMGGAITYGDANMKRVGQSWNKPRGETRAIVKNFVDLMRQLLDSTDSSRIKS